MDPNEHGTMIVHVLYAGQPMCGFTTKVPGNWPEGHKWIGRSDAASIMTNVNCTSCKAAYELWRSKSKP